MSILLRRPGPMPSARADKPAATRAGLGRIFPEPAPTATEMRLWPQTLRTISATLQAGLSLRDAVQENRTRSAQADGLPSASARNTAAESKRRTLHARLLEDRHKRAFEQTQQDIDDLLDTLAREEALGLPPGTTVHRAHARRTHSRARLKELSLCLRMNETTGAPLAHTLRSAAEHAEEHLDAMMGRESALTGPKTTGKILSWLPLIGLAMGWLMGTDPLGALTGSVAGVIAGILGITLAMIGRRWTNRLVRRAEQSSVLDMVQTPYTHRDSSAKTSHKPGEKSSYFHLRTAQRKSREKAPQDEPLDPALILELLAAQLQAGLSLSGALQTLGQSLPQQEIQMRRALERIGSTLMIGADWHGAWAGYEHPLLQELARLLAPAYSAGTPSAALLRHCAATYRLEERRAAERASAKLAVALVLPLGLCSLPAFICCGVVPILISLLPGLLI